MNVLLKTGYIYIYIYIYTFFSPDGHPHSSHTEILIHHYYIIPSKSSLTFRAVNMTGKREDNSAIKSVAYSSQGSHTGQLYFCN